MNENEIIMENLDTMEDVIEVIPEKKGVNFGKVGIAVLAVGAAVALGYKVVKVIKQKKAQKAQEAEDITADQEIIDSECEESAE